jgi:WD40 repeat protein/serine/threonine protein kinase
VPEVCISSERMRAFLAGDLAASDEQAVVGHLESCPLCERLASEMSDDREVRKLAAGHSLPIAEASEPEIEDLRRRLHALGLFAMAVDAAESDTDTKHFRGDGSAHDVVTGNGSDTSDARQRQNGDSADEQSAAAEPTQLGHYDVLKTLGAGSFGIVYLAEDRRLRRRVAIKMARASVLTDPVLRQRFFREAEALARLAHPHILPVYEADEIEGLCFLVLAYCDGPTLDDWFHEQEKPLEPTLAARLVLPLTDAVEHAHSRGILHRDIKPANILLAPSEPTDSLPFSPQLTDFGLAKVLEEKGSETLTGMVLGTACYMAPEQAAGHLERIGPATDVYSLGAVLYQLLTGRVPIEGNSTIDTLRRLLIDEPTEVRELARDVPDDLGAIARKCLQKSPGHRYASAAALADDLRRFLDGRPTQARPLGTTERLSRWVRRNKVLASLLLLATAVLGLSVGLFHIAERLSHSEQKAQQVADKLDRANQQALTREQFVAQHSYANDLFTAGQSTQKGDITQAVEALRRQLPSADRPDLRGLEWHYLWALNTNEPQVYSDAGNELYHLCLSPDGRQLAAVGSRSLLRLYDADQLALQFSIQTGQVETNGVAFSPSGQLAATAGDDGSLRVIDLATRKERLKIPAHPEKAFGVAFFDGETKLVSCGNEPIIRLWDAATGESLGQLEGHTGRVEAIAISPNAEMLASAGSDKIAILWNLKERKNVRTLRGHSGALMGVCFSPDGRLVATGSMDNSVIVWITRNGRKQESAVHLDRVQAIAFSADGSRLFVGDRSGSVYTYVVALRSPTDGRIRLNPDADTRAWHAHDKRVWSIAAGREAGTFFTSGADHLLRRWDRRPLARAEQTLATPPGDMFVDLDYSPDGKLLFALRKSSGITAYDAQTLMPRLTLDCRHGEWRTLKVLAGRDEVAAGNEHGIVAIWNYKTGELMRLIGPPSGSHCIMDICYSHEKGLFAVSGDDRDKVRLYRAETGQQVASFTALNHAAIAISPDSRHVAFDALNSIVIADTTTQETVAVLKGHTATVNSIAYSPDGKLMASASGDRTVRLWTADGGLLTTLTGHLADVTEVAFTPDGRTLLSLDDRAAIVATHIGTRQNLLELPLAAERLRALAISPTSRQAAAIREIKGTHQVVVFGGTDNP